MGCKPQKRDRNCSSELMGCLSNTDLGSIFPVKKVDLEVQAADYVSRCWAELDLYFKTTHIMIAHHLLCLVFTLYGCIEGQTDATSCKFPIQSAAQLPCWCVGSCRATQLLTDPVAGFKRTSSILVNCCKTYRFLIIYTYITGLDTNRYIYIYMI